ncbi:hypothetical protein GCM10027037_14330 [Mucilaginibacter koreensis]
MASAQQSKTEDYISRLEWYSKSKPSALIYVHFDKGVYTNNENIWFTAYVLKDAGLPLEQYHTLSVLLVKDDDRTIALKGKFAMAKGLGFGNLLLPDTILPGNYHLLAYTNMLNKEGEPLDVYSQPIAVKTVANQTFDAAMQIIDTGARAGHPLQVKVKVTPRSLTSDEVPVCQVNYRLGSNIKGHVKTNKQGEAIITIPAATQTKETILFANIKYKDEIKNLSIAVPQSQPAGISVKFYPEGGNMVAGQLNTIGWEAKTTGGQPVQVSGVLYKDGISIDTIETAAYGIGKIRLMPMPGSRYRLKLLNQNAAQKNTLYELPAAISGLPVLNIPRAVANDTLLVQIKLASPQTISLLIHNYQDVFLNKQMHLPATGANRIKLAMQEMPKGLMIATLLDSLGRPVAERMFFAHYNQPEHIEINTGKAQYNTREKVTLKLKLTDLKSNQPLQGHVSVACVQSNRLVPATQQDMESYVYLNHALGTLPFNNKGRAYASMQFIEDVLLVKGWRRYSWKEAMTTQAQDTLQNNRSTVFTGNITRFDKTLKKPALVNILAGGALKQITTDAAGNFTVSAEDLISEDGKKLLITANAAEKNNYITHMTDPYEKLNRTVADQLLAEEAQPALDMQNSTSMALNGMQKNNLLKEVIIKARKDNSITASNKVYLGREVDYYVCIYNIMNCPNHPPGTPGTIVYYTTNSLPLAVLRYEGINLGKEFYGSDYSQINLSTPEYYSTVYWNHAVWLTHNKEAELSFYVSDLTGNFRVIVQGLSNNGILYAEKDFSVSNIGNKH